MREGQNCCLYVCVCDIYIIESNVYWRIIIAGALSRVLFERPAARRFFLSRIPARNGVLPEGPVSPPRRRPSCEMSRNPPAEIRQKHTRHFVSLRSVCLTFRIQFLEPSCRAHETIQMLVRAFFTNLLFIIDCATSLFATLVYRVLDCSLQMNLSNFESLVLFCQKVVDRSSTFYIAVMNDSFFSILNVVYCIFNSLVSHLRRL